MDEHGGYSLSSENQVVTLRATGAWNIETVNSCCKAFKATVEQIKNQSWSCIIELSDWELGPPEMWTEIIALNIWSEVNNKKFEAVVITNNVQRYFFEQLHKTFINAQAKFFNNEIDAITWLNAQK
ncbi:hypothetical protein [Thalassotalea atypica]|uniref:hypothetical protein n=1 Tax=Thalassotalea atypica TaxID=2054316 RepID=UPI002572C0CE|nr:hypothetical protein [Thalassotalea atypica]